MRTAPSTEAPEIVRLISPGTGLGAQWQITLGGAGTMTLPAREVLRYRTFHARAMERLLMVFAWVDPKEWFYRVMQAMCRTAAEDAGELYKPDVQADR